jgi:hypothetical protein
MATAAQAQRAYDDTRDFYKPGVKSSNKRYNGIDPVQTLANEKDIWLITAHNKVLSRDINASLSSYLRKDIVTQGKTPVQLGAERYGGGYRAGNCGVMAAVAMYRAQQAGVLATDMWLVTAKNATTVHPQRAGSNMSFGHSWAQIGTVADLNGPFIVDPWAGVFCPAVAYAATLTTHLGAWQRQGKRIAVQWDNDTNQDWMNANDPAILSLVGPGRTRTAVRGDQIM